MTRRGRGHAKWDFCMYRSSPIKLIFPGVIQQTVQSHSCHHNIVIWTIEMANDLNSILVQTSCSLLCIMIFVWSNGRHCSDNEDIATCAGPLWCVGLFELCSAFSPVCCSVVKQQHNGKTLKAKISVRRRLS